MLFKHGLLHRRYFRVPTAVAKDVGPPCLSTLVRILAESLSRDLLNSQSGCSVQTKAGSDNSIVPSVSALVELWFCTLVRV